MISVKDRRDLASLPDEPLFAQLVAERRALLTENVADFVPIANRLASAGDDHYGLVFTSPKSMPRSKATIGLYVAALDTFLHQNAEEDALLNQVQWLPHPR